MNTMTQIKERPELQDRSDMTLPYTHITVLGAGSWGTAIASLARRAGRQTTLWARDPLVAETISHQSRNHKYLPDIDLPNGIQGTHDLKAAVKGAEAVFVVVPSGSVRRLCRDIRAHLAPDVPVIVCAKGIELETGHLMSSVVRDELPGHPVGTLSGPTFAAETARGDYTAATIAFDFAPEDRLDLKSSPAARTAMSLGSATFRPYVSDDLIGVEAAGAMKNVIAIACGMMTGAGFAENTRAALIAQGLEEMKLLATALGGRRATVTGLSGVGDLTLTCSSKKSRNMSLGYQLGQGIARQDCFAGQPVVVEGERNAHSVHLLANQMNLDLPICDTVFRVLHEGANLNLAFARLWARPIEAEPFEMDFEIPHPTGFQVAAE